MQGGMLVEEFKDVIGYEGLYQVSNFGRIKSFNKGPERILKQSINTTGYFYVNLYKDKIYKSRTVHQLVAESFLLHKPCGYRTVIDHIDNNPLNNNVTNLQLVSNRINSSKDRTNGKSKFVGVGWHNHNKKWYAAIRVLGNKKYLGYFDTEEEASKAYQKELVNHEKSK